MSRRCPRGALAAVLLILTCQSLAVPAHGQAPVADAKAAPEGNRSPWGETRNSAPGKTAEAIAAAEAMLAIEERKVLREDDANLAGWLDWLASSTSRRGLRGGESGAARGAGDPAEGAGRSDWRVVDAR